MGLTQALGFSVENGRTVVTTAGTPVPLLGIAYATGTVTTAVGSDVITGASTVWTLLNTVGMTMKTAGGNKYKIREFIDATHVRIEGVVASAEAGVAYQNYRRPKTYGISLQVHVGSAGTKGYFGIDGQVDQNSSPIKGFELVKGAVPTVYPIDLASSDIWVDVDTSGERMEWMIYNA
jgi:hypothetical protein